MGQPSRLGYVTGIADLLDFRRFHSPSGPVQQVGNLTSLTKKLRAVGSAAFIFQNNAVTSGKG